MRGSGRLFPCEDRAPRSSEVRRVPHPSSSPPGVTCQEASCHRREGVLTLHAARAICVPQPSLTTWDRQARV
jgi:hypothetical protein